MSRRQAPPNLNRLHPDCAALFARHPVRKKAAQKAAFRAEATNMLRAAGWPVRTETSGRWLKSHNLVAGDPASATLVLTAHYDTPARMPLPNFITPRNLPFFLLCQLLLVLLFIVIFFGAVFLGRLAGLPRPVLMLLPIALSFLLVWLLLAGPANRSNANDNTSGTLALVQLAHSLPPECRDKIALVFFDLEELGLVGSAHFRAAHGPLADRLLLNFDCVGDGDTLLFIPAAGVRKNPRAIEILTEAFPPGGGKQALIDTSPFSIYPSDQLLFQSGVGVAATRKAPVVGHYIPHLHTGRDRVLQQQNLLYLAEGVARLAKALSKPEYRNCL